jgi:hypothetical protein
MRPLKYFETHFFLPAPHFVWSIVPGSIASTNPATQSSTRSSVEPVSSKLMQSLGFLFSSFSKQPFVGSRPPVYFAVALSMQAFAFGSFGLFGV